MFDDAASSSTIHDIESTCVNVLEYSTVNYTYCSQQPASRNLQVIMKEN